MRLLLSSAVVVTLLAATGQARAEDFYVDPEGGSADGDGSAGNPWRTLQEVVEAGLVETRHWASLPYEVGGSLETVNVGAPVGAGDTIWLRSGYHGAVEITGAYNESPITIAAEAGETPQLSRIMLRAASGWVLRGLSVSPSHAPSYEAQTMIDIDNHGWHGPSHDIVIEQCELFSVDDTSGWSAGDWVADAANGITVDGDDSIVRDNVLRNVRFGISVSGENARVARNVVDSFSGDGLRGLGDYGVFEHNVVKNCYDVDDNHDDGFQSWSVGEGGVGTGEVRGIVLRGNVIINYEDPDQPHRGPLQGIGCFDGMFVDWIVENNVIVVDHWHGITLSGARGCRIVNNTVIDMNDKRPGPAGIRVGKHKNGTVSMGCTVRNNLVTSLNIQSGPDVVVDHNLVIDGTNSIFVDPARRDLRLKARCPAVDSGHRGLAPETDIAGTPRPQGRGVDIGAYEL